MVQVLPGVCTDQIHHTLFLAFKRNDDPNVGSVGLCRHDFEPDTICWHKTNILQHNAVVSENCEKCIQILPAPRCQQLVDKSGNILGNTTIS